jgi:MHS family proline/betaine transporter-like MFS transporter
MRPHLSAGNTAPVFPAPAEQATRSPSSRHALVVACIGNVVEWYDFAIYGALATILAGTYFPNTDKSTGLLASFAVFATAFLARPFGALLLGLTGLYLRLRVEETPAFRAVQQADTLARRPLAAVLRAFPGRLLAGFLLVAAVSLTFNTFFIFLPSHLVSALGVPLSSALAAALSGLALVVAMSPALGSRSDRVGRKPLLAAGTVGQLVLTVPAYLLIRRAEPAGLLLGYLLVGLAVSCFVLPSFLSELFPTEVRSTALALTYGLASALVGGTAPLVDTLLVQRTGNPLVPAWYATAVTLAAAVGVLLTRETAFRPLQADRFTP